MQTIKLIITEKKETEEVKGLVEVYEELAASKMQTIRDEIINARDFFERLARLSSEVGADLETQGLGKSGDVCVFISSSTGLYGDLIDKIFVSFTKFTRENPEVSRIVLGKYGDSMMKSYSSKTDYTYFDMDEEQLTGEDLSTLVKELVKYKKIYLFYGKFKNIINQETWTQVISGQVLGEIQDKLLDAQKFKYLYEPNVNIVSKVFTEEIAGSVFNQTIKESELARYASRLMFLDAALDKIDDKIDLLSMQKNKAVKRSNERKQLVSFTAISSLYQ